MSEQKLKIGLLGMGTVGGGVAAILERHREALSEKAGAELVLERVLVRDPRRPRAVDLPAERFTTEAASILHDPSIDLVVELMGGIEPARSYILEALRRGKYVVTANKDLMARHGTELLEEAQRHRARIYYEASVGGGIPLIRPLKHCLAANRIEKVIGIINGTTNYILTRMALEGSSFQEALAEAQARGFAEADPANDLEGRDAAYKLAIIAALAFRRRIAVEDIYVEGIAGVAAEDIRYARELGYAIKLLAVGEELLQGLALRVHPTLVPATHPLASVLHEFNAVYVVGDAVGEVMFYGRGAGAMPTGSAVVADIIDAARTMRSRIKDGIMETTFAPASVLPVSRLVSRFYLRLQAQDRPGVFAALATAFGEEQVSLDMIIQKRSEAGTAEIVLVTHDVIEERFNRAMQRIEACEAIETVNSVFRVLE